MMLRTTGARTSAASATLRNRRLVVNDAPDLDHADDVDVTAGAATEDIDATLATAGHITGTVTGGGGALEDIDVTAYRSDGDGGWDYVRWARTADDGTYDLGGLPTGSYRVEFQDWSGEYARQCYNDKPDLDHAHDVDVTAGAATPNIDAVLATAGHITGTVTKIGGGALEDIDVTAYRSDGDGGWEDVRWARTADDGTYDLGGLPTGSYRVEFQDWSGEYARQCYNDKPDLDHADDVGVVAGVATPNIDATLATAGHITGTVTKTGGGALGDISVYAYRSDGSGGWAYVDWASTAGDGTYDLGGLPTGSYRVEFQDWSGEYARQCYNNEPDLDHADGVDVTAGAPTEDINATLATAGHITGTVTKTGGGALEDIAVTAYRSDGDGGWEDVSYAETDASGAYDLGGLPTGSYRVEFEDCYGGEYAKQCYNNKPDLDHADDVAVTAGAATPNIDAALFLPPTVASFTPTSGLVGAAVTLTGTNFTGATKVSFHGADQTALTVVSATQITTTVPSGATSGTISVTTPGGTGTSAASFTVTVPPPPPEPTPTPTPTPSQAPLPTGSGQAVTVSGFTVTFPQVASAGTLTGTISVPPAGTAVPGCSSVAVTLKLETNAAFSGEVEIKIPIAVLRANGYAGPIDKLRLMHQASSGAWEDVTWKLTATDIYGKVTSFSSFAVARDTAKPVVKALKAVSVKRNAKAKLRFKVSDAASKTALTTIKIYKGKKLKKTLKLGQRATNKNLTYSYKCKLAKGSYTWKVYATDLAGNAQAKVASRKLRVK